MYKLFLQIALFLTLTKGKKRILKSERNHFCFLEKSCNCIHNLPLMSRKLKLYRGHSNESGSPLQGQHNDSDHHKDNSSCTFRWLSPREAAACLTRAPVVFIGDSRMNQIAGAVYNQMCNEKMVNK